MKGLNCKDMIRTLKQSRQDSSGKHYVWILYGHDVMMCGAQNSTKGYVVL